MSKAQNEPPTLTAEQQLAVAEIQLGEIRRMERLLRNARTYPGKHWVTFAFLILALWVAGKNVPWPYHVVAFSLIMLNFTLLHVHIHGINRRLDALLTLRNTEVPNRQTSEPPRSTRP
jgi:hypothetical protein